VRVWLVTVGEPLPSDSGSPRLLRAGILADRLWKRGHQVVWWTSAFDHRAKRQRGAGDETIKFHERYELRLLRGPGYRRNVSLARLLDHRAVAKKFLNQAIAEPPPDIIVASFPTIELSAASARFGRKRGIPVVLDIRDLWPDIFLELVPAWLRPMGQIALAPMYRQTRRALVEATAIVSNAQPFVEWGLRLARRKCGPDDREFPFGYNASIPNAQEQDKAIAFWQERGISRTGGRPIACFFGTFGRQFDIDTVIKAARILEHERSPIRFVLCGEGERLSGYRDAAGDLANVMFPGWVDAPKIWTLMRMSTVGLAPYVSRENFLANLPNKPIEYLSASLPVVSSIDGYLGSLLRDFNCGVIYPAGEPSALADALREFGRNAPKLAQLSQNASRVFAQRFDADVVYVQFAEYLENMGARNK
jgi:glycosyltransferase involved in cell wall biosynthesis